MASKFGLAISASLLAQVFVGLPLARGAAVSATQSASVMHRRVATAAWVRPSHIVNVIEENHSYMEFRDNTRTPYLKSLFAQGATCSNYHAVEHPSFPNYLDLFSGSDQHHASDATDLTISGQPNLATELTSHHFSVTGYAEDLPPGNAKSSSYFPYAPNHVPWVYFNNVSSKDSLPFSVFPRNYNKLPTVSFVIPNLQDDMHTGSIPDGDKWLKVHSLVISSGPRRTTACLSSRGTKTTILKAMRYHF